MAVNRDKPDRWKADIEQSVDMYNNWFIRFAPEAYRTTRFQTTIDVKATLEATENLTDIDVELLRANPSILPTLRMATCPPLAVDPAYRTRRGAGKLVKVMERTGSYRLGCPGKKWTAPLARSQQSSKRWLTRTFSSGWSGETRLRSRNDTGQRQSWPTACAGPVCEPHHSECPGKAAA